MTTTFNYITNNIESNKVFYLTIYLIIYLVSYILHKVGDGAFKKKFSSLDISEDLFKLFVTGIAIFFMTEFYNIFKGGVASGWFIVIFAIAVPLLTFLQPFFDSLVSDEQYNYIGLTKLNKSYRYILIALFLVFIYLFLVPNFLYEENYATKMIFIIAIGLLTTIRSFFGGKDLAMWSSAFLLLLGIPPQYMVLNSVLHVLLTPYVIHGIIATDFKIFR